MLANPPPLTKTPPFKNTLPLTPMPPPTTMEPEVMEDAAALPEISTLLAIVPTVRVPLVVKFKLDATMLPAVKEFVPKFVVKFPLITLPAPMRTPLI